MHLLTRLDGIFYCIGTVKAQAPFGWSILDVLQLILCCQNARTLDLGVHTVIILKTWLCPAVQQAS